MLKLLGWVADDIAETAPKLPPKPEPPKPTIATKKDMETALAIEAAKATEPVNKAADDAVFDDLFAPAEPAKPAVPVALAKPVEDVAGLKQLAGPESVPAGNVQDGTTRIPQPCWAGPWAVARGW